MKPKVFVVTLNWNRKDDTIKWTDSVQKMYYLKYETVIVDNDPTDGSTDAFLENEFQKSL